MISRNLPLILLALVMVALSSVVLFRQDRVLPPSIEPEQEENLVSFTGRMVMPSLDDFYVLENSSGRNLPQFERFLQGRAAGLHWLANDHFKQKRSKRQPARNIYIWLKMTVDSLGYFSVEELFSNTDDQNLKDNIKSHIENLWRYPRSEGGKLEVWMPIIWKADWSLKAKPSK